MLVTKNDKNFKRLKWKRNKINETSMWCGLKSHTSTIRHKIRITDETQKQRLYQTKFTIKER